MDYHSNIIYCRICGCNPCDCDDTVIGIAIEPRLPAHKRPSTRQSLIRDQLKCGPFLSAFDAGIDSWQPDPRANR